MVVDLEEDNVEVDNVDDNNDNIFSHSVAKITPAEQLNLLSPD